MEISETISLVGTISIDGKIIAQANATVGSREGAVTSYVESVNDYKKYTENLVECRQQFDAFKKKVREREDEMLTAYHTPKPEAPVGE